MVGQPISMNIPKVLGFNITGSLREGITATDLVLTITEKLRKHGVVGKFVEFYGGGLDSLSLADRATISNMAPEYGATCGFFPTDQETINYLHMTGKDKNHLDIVKAYTKKQKLWNDKNIEQNYDESIYFNLDKDVELGPMTTKKRLNEIEELVETTKKEGAKVLCGGKRPAGFNKGYFYEPTVFDNVNDSCTIMKQEPFGPLVPLTTFKDYDEVIERANNHELGLASYIYTNSMEKAHKTSELMETGVVAVNTAVVAVAEAPFGGIKQTGYGREGGSMGIKDYLNIKYTHLGIKN